jgi:hypothetical protein
MVIIYYLSFESDYLFVACWSWKTRCQPASMSLSFIVVTLKLEKKAIVGGWVSGYKLPVYQNSFKRVLVMYLYVYHTLQ